MIHLYMPDEYDGACSAEVRYPVIYMFDGHNLFYDGDATRLFMSWGTEEDYRGWTTKRIHRMESAAQKHGICTWLYNQQGGRHCEADWEIQIPTWMQFLWL